MSRETENEILRGQQQAEVDKTLKQAVQYRSKIASNLGKSYDVDDHKMKQCIENFVCTLITLAGLSPEEAFTADDNDSSLINRFMKLLKALTASDYAKYWRDNKQTASHVPMTILLTLDKILTKHTANALLMALDNKERCTGEKAKNFTRPLAQLEGLIEAIQEASETRCTPSNWLSVPPQYTALQAKKEKDKQAKKKQKEEEKEKKRQKDKENYNPQPRDYNLNQSNTKNWFGNKGGTNYNLNRYRNGQGGGNGLLPGGLPPDLYNNNNQKDDNFFKGIFKKNSKGQKLPSTRDGGARAPVITIEHKGRTKDGQLCLKGSTKFTSCRFGDECRFIHLEEGELQKVKKGKKDLAGFQKAFEEVLSFSNKEEGETAARGD
jgi:hypothetical protein